MSISANSLISDSVNFFKNQLSGLFTIVLLASVVGLAIYAMMIPSEQMIGVLVQARNKMIESGNSGLQDWILNLSEEDKSSILRVSFGLILSVTLGSLVLICGTLSYIAGMSRGEHMTGIQATIASLNKAPSMFLLLVVCSLLIQLGITIMVLPGIVLAIGFSLAPAILISERTNPFSAMGKSWKMAYANWRIVLPMILIWMAAQMIISILLELFNMNHIAINGISFLLNNFVAAFALIYFYRLYMLINKNQ
ncbi:YciC family protein [Providencia sp. Me31A]|uniref:YciC family protein n=1 Tax=Providencia sp. Me31A TaxID=3392637 RepID=UPI003D2CA310